MEAGVGSLMHASLAWFGEHGAYPTRARAAINCDKHDQITRQDVQCVHRQIDGVACRTARVGDLPGVRFATGAGC